MKKILAMILVLVLVLSLGTTTVFAGYGGQGGPSDTGQYQKGINGYQDLDNFNWGENEVYELTSGGMLKGYGDGSFRPSNDVTNLEAVTMVVRMMGWEENKTDSICKFDLDQIPEWGRNYVSIADEMGVFQGIDEFNPNDAATREVIAQYVINAYGNEITSQLNLKADKYADDGSISEEYLEAVYQMKELGLMIGDNNAKFNPLSSVRRIEMAMIMHRHCHTYTYRNLTGLENLRVSVLIDDNTARYNIDLEPVITAEFSEDIFYIASGDVFNQVEAADTISFTEYGGDEIEFTVVLNGNIWTIVPEKLEYDTDYQIVFDRDKIVNTNDYKLSEQNEVLFTTMLEPVEGSVSVASISPEDESEDVMTSSNIVITFTEEVYNNETSSEPYSDDTATTAVKLEKYVESAWEIINIADYSIDVNDEVWTVYFDEDLDYNMIYRITILDSEILNFTGQSVYTFTTVGKTMVEYLPLGDEVAVDSEIVLTFDELIIDDEGADFTDTSILDVVELKVNDEAVPFTATVVYSTTDTVVTLDQGDYLKYGSAYEITIDENGIEDGIENDTTSEFSVEIAPLDILLVYSDESTISVFDGLGPYSVSDLESIEIVLSDDIGNLYDVAGVLLDDSNIADHIVFEKDDTDPLIEYTVSISETENVITIEGFETLEDIDHILQLSEIYYDSPSLKLYFGLETVSIIFDFQ